LFALSNQRAAGQLVSLLERLDGRSARLRVLTYHRVADPEKTPLRYPRVTVKPAAFEQQLRFLSQRYPVVSMADVLRAVAAGGRLPERAVLITFDDATRDFVENALPVLERYHLPATLFVPTAFPGRPELAFWWDRLYSAIQCADGNRPVQTPLGPLPVGSTAQRKQAFNRLRAYVKSTPHQAAMAWVDRFCAELQAPPVEGDVLTWEELRQVVKAGVALGAHTRTHPMMDQIPAEVVRSEAAGSRQDLREQTGEMLPIFAYPSGGYNREVLKILAEEGFQLAFTTQRGLNAFPPADPYQVRRVNVGPRTTLPLLRAQLLSWMSQSRSPEQIHQSNDY
jgi:peptidoglycan/xylan/chitin deacetylase (PgdA/CDA1 family)